LRAAAPKEEIMTQNYALMQHFVLVTQGMRPPKGEVYAPTESPKGELGFYIKSEGEPYAYRLKCRAPSFFHTGFYKSFKFGHHYFGWNGLVPIPFGVSNQYWVFGWKGLEPE